MNSVRAMLQGFAALGIDRERVLAGAGLAEPLLSDPDRMLDAALVFRLWGVADGIFDRPGLGLHTGAAVPFGAYGLLDHLITSSATVGAGLSALSRFTSLATTTIRYDVIDEGGRTVALEMVVLLPPGAMPMHLRDYGFALMASHVGQAAGLQLALAVELAGDPLAPEAEYRRVFGCPVRFQAKRIALAIDRGTWERPLPRRDPSLQQVLERYAEALLERAAVPGGATEAVRAALAEALSEGRAEIEALAARLGTSPRTLQRRLREEGTSFRALLEEVRGEVARSQLEKGQLSVAEIATLLGYSEPSAFHRAFKRWTGRAPRAYRRRARC